MKRILSLLLTLSTNSLPAEELNMILGSLAQFEANTIAMYGQQGKNWLANLPTITTALAQQWGLSNLIPLKNLSYNYILSGFQGTRPIIVKISFDQQESAKELQTLKALKSPCVVDVLAYDPQYNALLLERAVPGDTLWSLFPDQDVEATEIVCELIQQLPQPPIVEHAALESKNDDNDTEIIDKDWNIPHNLLHKARILKKELLATAPQTILLHGDLHAGNIVKQQNHWIIIDPTIILGEQAIELAIFVIFPHEKLFQRADVEMILKRRILIAAQKLHLDPERIQRWCFVRIIMTWAWNLKHGIDPTESAYAAQLLNPSTPSDLQTPSPLCHREDTA
jgi:streptomycin 6-kinase